jgi:hypothetical protein
MVLATSLAAPSAVRSSPAAAAWVQTGPTTGGFATDNVEHVRHIPLSTNGVGGRLIGDYFYTNDQNKVMIFDISVPEDPTLVGFVPMPQEFQFSREDIDGNGKILVVPNTVARLIYIIDVEDKTDPRIISEVPGAQHTISCILDCKYAYGSDGNIIDIRDPLEPKLLEEKWGDGPRVVTDSGHDVEEIAPGIVLTATQPIQLLDARKDPVSPRLIASGANTDGRFIHTPRWPNKGKDDFLLMAGETTNNLRCNDNAAAFMTWDASKWKRTKTFSMIDEYRMRNGMYADGSPAAGRTCSSHWHEAHPRFKNGGLVAAAFFEHGTRFIDVSPKGKIKEIGFFLPYAGSTSAVYWITDRIAYAVDYNRGIDILRFTGKL